MAIISLEMRTPGFEIFIESGFSDSNHCSRGVTTIYAGTGCAIIWGAFFRAENKFWGIIFGKITSIHNFWGVILEK